MPGIAGIICKKNSGDKKKKLDIMLTSMLHEKFYSYGTYINRKLGFFIGYVSLEDSFSDCMPIFNEKKDLVLFLTGECYIEQEKIISLRNNGHEFNIGNASFLIHLYEEMGERFFESLNGWYNGIILELKTGKAILFNDRYGIRRLYWHQNNESFIFSSEAKSLLKAFPFLRSLSLQSIGEYFVYDCVLENRTYFTDINLLPPGSKWSYMLGNVCKKCYFDPSYLEKQTLLSREQFFEELSYSFKKILPQYLTGKSIGMSLTGGLDTRMIMACLNLLPGELPCYTFGGMYRDILDVRLAPQVAEICNQSHQVLRLNDEKFLSDYPSQVERSIYITDGLESVDKADVIYFNKLAREVAPIRITGKYGSQVLKSVIGLKDRSPYTKLFDLDFLKYVSMAKETFHHIKKRHAFSFLLFNEISWWWNGFIASESSQVTVRSPFLDNDLIKLLYRMPLKDTDIGIDFELNFIKKHNPDLLSVPTTGTFGGNRPVFISKPYQFLLQLLINMDKIYIRERLPLSMTHWVGRLDYLLKPLHIDKLFMGLTDFRRYRVWYRDQLAGFLCDALLNKKTYDRPYWNKSYLEKVVNSHIKGRGTYLREIRKILQVEMINRVLIENL